MLTKMAMKRIPLMVVALVMLVLLVTPSGCASTGSLDHSGVCLIDDESKTLHTEEYWILQEGYAIELKQIDLNGTKAWVAITKDGTEVDSMVIHLHNTDIFTKSIDLQEHVLVISIEALKISRPAEEATLLVCQYSDGVGSTKGSIGIASSPEGARIYFDAEHKGYTPKTLTGISPGSHTIRLEKSGYDDYTETVRVSAGTDTTISAPLSASATSQAEETRGTGAEPDNWQMVPDAAASGAMTPADAAVLAPVPGAALTIIGLMMAAIIIGMKNRP